MLWERFLFAAALFLAAGVAQLLWIIPSLKRWKLLVLHRRWWQCCTDYTMDSY